MTGVRRPDGTVGRLQVEDSSVPLRCEALTTSRSGRCNASKFHRPQSPHRDGERERPAGDHVTDDVLHLGLEEVDERGVGGRPDPGNPERTIAAWAVDAKLEPARTADGHREVDHVVPGPVGDGFGMPSGFALPFAGCSRAKTPSSGTNPLRPGPRW